MLGVDASHLELDEISRILNMNLEIATMIETFVTVTQVIYNILLIHATAIVIH